MRPLAMIPGVFMLLACAGEKDPAPVDTDPIVPPPNPTVSIQEPLSGAEVAGDTLRVVVTPTDFELTRKDEVALRLPLGPLGWAGAAWGHEAGELPNGYIAYRIDGTVLAETIETDVTLALAGLSAGPHTLSAELHYPDGDGFYPPALAEVVFQITGG
jgi:hypothetical protein